MKPIRLVAGVMTVGFWTLMSRVLGVVREVMILALIGPGPVMDAFVAAFRLPNLFRRFFAEGAFNAAFVPLFSKKYEGEEDPLIFARDALNGLATVLLALTALAMIFMPALVWATAGGFAGDARFDLTVGFGRVVFPYILLISLAALFSGALNATGHFAAAAAAPVLLNILVCLAMGMGAALGGDVVQYLIWAVPVAGVAQLALVWVAADRAGVRIRPGRPRLTPDMKRLVVIAVPAALAGGVMQINLLVGQQVASHFDKAVGWLYAADRLYQLPLGVVGIAVGIVLLPDLSRRLKAQDDSGARNAFSRAGELSLALTVPAAVALVAIPLPMVSVLFERGATTANDSAAIAVAVAIYGLGLPAFVLQKVLQPLYFAREDTRSPFRFAVWAMVINAAVAIGLAPMIGWLAPAIATTLAGWVMVWQLARGAKAMGEVAHFDDRFRQRLWRIVAASLVMGAVLWGLNIVLTPWLALPYLRLAVLAGLIGMGILTYGVAGQALGAFRLAEIKAMFKRSRA
ncbi:putative lipid II flippase MurJ [Mameliella alba]|uniref:murein biosynthesis integral membrane protein MurJ n=1 Tax=Mameliella TaxID=1434019 RepID=UPI000B533B67|nr:MULTISPECIES: murein biosynthesis integral membrane protein MurJ [Mameliella]MCR9275333.1 murein biosynthesis integral membrane protein MurJ [Paracoccaceae bacterium]OWV61098.1 murein biosynthesis integral membrane protein MurJ [Mameliella alba]BBU58720.1 putative lipid II flippase MurJ [Mameliella alba]